MLLTGMFIHHLDWKYCLELRLMGSGAFSGKMSAESLWIWLFPAPWSGRDLATTALARWHSWRSDIYASWRMTYDFSQSQNLMPPGHNRVAATPKGRWTLTQRGSTTPKKNVSVSQDCGKNQYWTWLTAWRHPNCYWICCKHLQTLLYSQKGRKNPSFFHPVL